MLASLRIKKEITSNGLTNPELFTGEFPYVRVPDRLYYTYEPGNARFASILPMKSFEGKKVRHI